MKPTGPDWEAKLEYIKSLYTNEEILLAARTAHSVGQACNEAFGIEKLPAWEQCDLWYRVQFTHWVEQYLYFGSSAAEIHMRFVHKKLDAGWTLGDWDEENKTRPDLVKFRELPVELRTKLKLIRAAVMPFRKFTYEDQL